ncbi:hypothetical protein SGQ83_22180 [Flavobacterium sp. Fl-318]|uniref:Uncharacterized protein n=1 Tax=Flavobacterium cupriresistens TaxID=2893885 RepID=A0ABU4RHN1_9FLAO|nr:MULTISPECIES: hypothetical protein [unclassified Flavobacterium]MDX6192064.1 hypothetical protein [Flavobacterium sp. Fl-318]UFH44680.1 hypothetical protein LNP23_10880 [Flavobacterium sp. F-323]
MNEIQQEIITHFENKNKNFKDRLRVEFNKPASAIENHQTTNYKNNSLNILKTELHESQNPIFDNVNNLLQQIEETLFAYLTNDDSL